MSQRSEEWRVLRREGGDVLLARLKWCTSFWCKFRGLMLRAVLPEDEGLVFVYDHDSRVDTTIHMLFMRFPIATLWLDAQGVVVDKVLAKPWRLLYAPKAPARFVIEAPPALVERVMIGDQLTFEDAAEAVSN
jgi:uncharacterized membrane protein (UPF0127 family)